MNIIKYSEKLAQYGKKVITKVQLEKLFSETDDAALFSIVDALQKQELLEPIHSAHTNGNRVYPIYLKYRITLPSESFDIELEEISKLHPTLQNGGFLQKKPVVYKRYRDAFTMLDRYLFAEKAVRIPISRKERSFEIFGEEKMLDDATFCRILEKLGLDKNRLAFYDTPEYCFNDFIPERKEKMTLLICENKDIWFNIRRRMFEDNASILFNTHIDGVVYGCGNQISQKNALTAYTDFMGGAQVFYLYWGDIDRAGLNIYLSLVKNNPGTDIALFISAYEEMLDLARNTKIPNSTDMRQILGDYEDIYCDISSRNREFLKENILENKRIPQEIISYEYLLQKMR